MKNQSFVNKLVNAIAGLRSAWQDELNFRVQVILGLSHGAPSTLGMSNQKTEPIHRA